MLKTIFTVITVFFCVTGIFTVIYFTVLHFVKNRPFVKTCLFIKLSGDYLKDVRTVVYALERKNLYCDSPNCKITALYTGKDNENYGKIKDLFRLCPSVSIIKTENLFDFIKNL